MTTIIFNPTAERRENWTHKCDDHRKILLHDPTIMVRSHRLFEEPTIQRSSTGIIISFGEIKKVAEKSNGNKFLPDQKILENATSFNGSFAQILASALGCAIITDRFGSTVVFIASTLRSELLISTSYEELIKEVTPEESGPLVEESIFEFLYMRRLFGEKTYHSQVRVLPAASVSHVEFNSGRTTSKKYWTPGPPSLFNAHEASTLLTRELKNATERRLASQDERYGLMLSGGLDSRALLAIGCDRYMCFTNTPKKNNEYEVAHRLASSVGATHHYLRRPRDYFERIFSDAIASSNSMTVFYEAQFLGYIEEIATYVDTVHLGIGLDIFFCGHYMNKYHPAMFGRQALYFKKTNMIEGNFEQDYLNCVSYRLKTSKLRSIVKDDYWKSLQESLTVAIKEKAAAGRSVGLCGHSLWEYMHLTDFGRHYSMLMSSSLRGQIDAQVPALDNELYNLAFSLSTDLKLNWNVYQNAIEKLSPGLFKVKNANTNIRASYDLFTQTGIQIGRSLVRRLGVTGIGGLPSMDDRSWPLVSDDMATPFMRAKIESMVTGGRINNLPFIDPQKLMNVFAEHVSGKKNHGVLFGLMLTLEHGVLSYRK